MDIETVRKFTLMKLSWIEKHQAKFLQEKQDVHELVYLLEPRHNGRFKAYIDHFMPEWRWYKKELYAKDGEGETF